MIPIPNFAQIFSMVLQFPSLFFPKLWLGPITMAFAPIFSDNKVMNWAKVICENSRVNVRTMRTSIPASAIISAFSSIVLIRKKSLSG